jgi:hypothetical protein
MNTLRITGAEPEILKVHHTRYLVEVLHLRLRDAKHLTDDILEGTPREVEVPAELAEVHAATLRILGAHVEILPERRVGAA